MIKKLVGKWFGFSDNEIKLSSLLKETEEQLNKKEFYIGQLLEQKDQLYSAYRAQKEVAEELAMRVKTGEQEILDEGAVSFYTQKLFSSLPLVDLTKTGTDCMISTIYNGKSEQEAHGMKADLAVVANSSTFRALCDNLINNWGNMALKSSTTSTDQRYWILRGYALGIQTLVEHIQSVKKFIDKESEPDEEFDVDEILPEN